jgi:tetratricopeptide (TPR) repeat protein
MALELDYFSDDRDAARESAVRAAETAIELDSELAEGHAALGLLLLDDRFPLGDPETILERAERSLQRALELDPSLSNASNWLSNVLLQQGRYEESKAVHEQGLLVDPLNPILSLNSARRLKELGERERAEQILMRLTHLPEPPGIAYSGLSMLYYDTGEFDKSVHWAKEVLLAYHEYPGFGIMLAWRYVNLGLTEDADYWAAVGLAHTPQPEQKFYYKAWQFQIRGDLAGLRTEIDKLHTALGPDIDALHGIYAAKYASTNVLVGNFDVGIDVFEKTFDFESLSTVYHPGAFRLGLEFSHVLAYAYQQVGRDDEAHVLLTQVHDQLNAYVVEQNMDFGPLHHLFAQNFGLRGDFDAAADALEAAIKAGWLRYLWVMHDPTWAETIANPRIARMLDDVKVELERQRVVVEQADAEHDFRAEFEALRSAAGD